MVVTVGHTAAVVIARTAAVLAIVEVDRSCNSGFEVGTTARYQTAKIVYFASLMGSLASVESAVRMAIFEFEHIRRDSRFELEEKSCIVVIVGVIVTVVVQMDLHLEIEPGAVAWS